MEGEAGAGNRKPGASPSMTASRQDVPPSSPNVASRLRRVLAPRTEVEPTPEEVFHAVHGSFFRQFCHVLTLLIVVLAWLALTEIVTFDAGQPHFLWDQLLTLVFLLAIRWGLSRWSVSSNALQLLGTVVVGLSVINGLRFVLMTPEAMTPTPLFFILIVAGSLFISVRWYAPVVLATVVVWSAFTWGAMTSIEREEYVAVTFMFALLSGFMLFSRARTLKNLERLRIIDQKQKQELHRALNVAHEELVERESSEAALRESEERYRHVVERSPVAIVLHDTEYITLANQALARLIGVPTPEQCLGLKIDDFIHPDSRDFITERSKTVLERHGSTPPGDIRIVAAEGTVREVEVTAQLVSLGGKPMVQAVLHDVTERRIAERAVRQSEERYRLLAENVTDGIWTADLDLRFTYLSPSIEKIFKIPVERALEIPVENMMTPESLQYTRQVLDELIGQARHSEPSAVSERTLELQFIGGDGDSVWTEVKARILRDAAGQPAAVLGVTRDITERRRAEENLRQSEERFRLLAEHATDVIFTSDLQLIFTFLSPAASRLFGYPSEEIDQCRPELLLAPSSLAEVRASLKEELERENQSGVDPFRSRTFELEYLTRDGGTVWTEVRVSFLRDPAGAPIGLVGVIRDIGERLRAQEEKRLLEAQLAQAQKLEAIGTLAGGIAHDFNNLLTGILGYADLLKLEAAEGDPVYESAEIIQTAATRARELTGQLLGFARKGKHRNIPVDLNQTIGEVVRLAGRTLNKNIEIETDLDPDRAVVLGDPAQLQQIVLNLALNASDAMPEGGVLRFETRREAPNYDAPQQRETQPGDGHVTLVVSDTGCGIPSDIQDRVFEPFYTTKEPGKGTGMGLAMVYGIVKNHGGLVELKSETGRGTTFRLRFPAAAGSLNLPAARDSKHIARGCGRILIVDDEPVVRAMAADMLRYLGYDVVTIGESREAVGYYLEHHAEIDLVLIDMIMPGLGGRECFLAMKEINPGVRAVLSTGYGQDAAAQQIIDEGVQGFIQKPYEVDRLSQAISRVLVA